MYPTPPGLLRTTLMLTTEPETHTTMPDEDFHPYSSAAPDLDSLNQRNQRANSHGRRTKDQILPANIPSIADRWSGKNEAAIKNIIDRYQKDDVLGIAYVIFGREGRHEMRVSGQCAEHPEMTSGMLMRMLWSLIAKEECTGSCSRRGAGA